MDEEFIGLDIGDVRVGVARASVMAGIAEPLAVWPATKSFTELKRFAKEKNLCGIVVGLPRNLQGEETDQTAKVRRWVDAAKEKIKANFYWQDEALTSEAALNRFGATRDNLDAMAAAIILQNFMDTAPAGRQLA